MTDETPNTPTEMDVAISEAQKKPFEPLLDKATLEKIVPTHMNGHRSIMEAEVDAMKEIRDKIEAVSQMPPLSEEGIEATKQEIRKMVETPNPESDHMRNIIFKMRSAEREFEETQKKALILQADAQLKATTNLAKVLVDNSQGFFIGEWSTDMQAAKAMGVGVLIGFPGGPVGEAYFDTVRNAWRWANNQDTRILSVIGASWMPMPNPPIAPEPETVVSVEEDDLDLADIKKLKKLFAKLLKEEEKSVRKSNKN